MKILVINRGSSSIKSSLYDFSPSSQCLIWESETESTKLDLAPFKNIEIDCIGHRIVHGGKKYQRSARIDPTLKKEIKRLSALAPLHNKADLEAIQKLENIFPNIPQVAVFDTAFHHTMDEAATTYPGPYNWLKMGIRRYGFHGISFQYCTRRAKEILDAMPEKMVICHLGSGASLCAVKNGKSVDTTMGFTPLEGLMMDTRSGTVDPGILLHLLATRKRTVKQLSRELYEKSGLLGLSGVSSSMRDILNTDTPRAKLALDVYVHRLSTMIGSMIATLGGVDTLVFTAGIGENAPLIRKRVCDQLSFLGIEIEATVNHGKDTLISSENSPVKVLVIHTQEALEIARECRNLQTPSSFH